MRSLGESFTWTVAMGRVPSMHDEKAPNAAPVGRYSTALCRIWVQILLICTRIERDVTHHGRTELDLGDPTT